MRFLLLTTLHSEFNAQLLKGKLATEGIQAKVDAVKKSASRYTTQPDTFGVYVPEVDINKAQKVFLEFVPLQPSGLNYPVALKVFYYVAGVALLVFLGYLTYEMFNYILTGVTH